MSINRWRDVEYIDDGCYLHQCLACYGEWESRTRPHHGGWLFCPLCGVRWEGQHECRPSDEPRFPRRDESYEESCSRYSNQRLWVIEKREIVEHDVDNSREERSWKVIDRWDSRSVGAIYVHDHLFGYKADYKAKVALEVLEELRERRECEEAGEEPFDLGCRILKEFRARIITRSEVDCW